MYKAFFGFKERPFKLVPDPAYLYLGQSHEEALGHLNYAVRQGDGFVVITGEVGTGKTTVCRMFLEKLDEQTETAYIFNPKLDSIQLLKAINDEFCIESSPDNTKDLIDILNKFLMEKKQQGKKAVLIIDESQNLTVEVLEQLRLLSNLETTKAKLLQIILVGQPEFAEKLDSFELRQLEQRITLNCHLNPLTSREIGEYISHRIQIASHKNNELFTKDAVREIFHYSGGVPRMINIVCDRALLCAYSRDVKQINARIARLAIQEITGKAVPLRTGFFDLNRKALALLALLIAVLGLLFLYPPVDIQESNAGPKPSENITPKSAAAVVDQKEQVKAPVVPDAEGQDQPFHPIAPDPDQKPLDASDKKPLAVYTGDAFGRLLNNSDPKLSRDDAMQVILKLWGTDVGLKPFLQKMEEDREYFVLAAKQNNLNVLRVTGDLALVKHLNHAVVMELYAEKDSMPRYMALVKLGDDYLVFETEKEQVQVMTADFQPFWNARFYVVWKNFYGYSKDVQIEKNGSSILILKRHLQEIGYCDIVLNSSYDNAVTDAVKDVQNRYGLEVDGIVGPLTEIALYNESKSLAIPHLSRSL